MQSAVLAHSNPLAAIVGGLSGRPSRRASRRPSKWACSAVDSVRATIARLGATMLHATGVCARWIAARAIAASTVSTATAATVTIEETPLLTFGPGGEHVENLFGLASTNCTLLLRSRCLRRLPSPTRPELTSDKLCSAPTVAVALRDLRARGLSVASAGAMEDRLLAIRDLRTLADRVQEHAQPAARGVMAVARIRAAADAWRRRYRCFDAGATSGTDVTDAAARPRSGAGSRRSRRGSSSAAISGATLFDTIVTGHAATAAASSSEPSSSCRSHPSGA